MNDTRRPDPRREACDELAERLAGDGGLQLARQLQLAVLGPAASAEPEPAPPSSAETPRPISIWHPRRVDGELVFERPEPPALGDHHAARRRIAARKPRGTLRICYFGESAAAGYLYAPHVTPAGLLERCLGELTRGRPAFEVVDLARTNETLEPLVAAVDAARQLAPDLLVLYAGNNWGLLETPEVSPYPESVAGRQRYAQALRRGGPQAAVELARRRLESRVGSAFGRIAELAAGVPVVVVLPEVNLADWESRQPPPWLPGDGNARWHALYRRARAQLEGGRWRELLATAEAMAELDGGGVPTAHRLRGRALLGLGRPAEAERAFRREVDGAAYATLCFLGAPQAGEHARGLLLRSAERHGFTVLDLAEVLAAEDGAPAGRGLFLDYCHLSLEGMARAVAALAPEVLARIGVAERSAAEAERALSEALAEVAPEVVATAHLGAAIHGAHRLLAAGGKGEVLEHWCRRALEASPGVAEAMLDLVAARAAPGPAVLTAAQVRNRGSAYALSLQHGWRWPHLDAELILAIRRALEAAGQPAGERIDRLLLEHLAVGTDTVDLSRPPYLWEPLERFFPEALPLDGPGERAFHRSPWPESSFCLITRADADLELEVTARLPGVEGTEERRGEVAVHLDGRRVASFAASERWCRQHLRLPAEDLTRGLQRLSLVWPPPPAAGERALEAARRRLELGLETDLHPTFGEVFSLRARVDPAGRSR